MPPIELRVRIGAFSRHVYSLIIRDYEMRCAGIYNVTLYLQRMAHKVAGSKLEHLPIMDTEEWSTA